MTYTSYGKTYHIQAGNATAEICEYGAYVTDWTVDGSHILYREDNIKRTGIPVLFPFAGPLHNDKLEVTSTHLPQHGFGRNVMWSAVKVSDTQIQLQLDSNNLEAQWKTAFPFEFVATITVALSSDGKLHHTILVTNLGKNTMPISPGLHPYFAIQHHHKNQVEVSTGTNWNGHTIDWNTWTGSDFLPAAPTTTAHLHSNTITITHDTSISTIVIWSGEAKDYICIEPITQPFNSINSNPILIPHKSNWKSEVVFDNSLNASI